ncbi:MAG TPA: hypothetical protein DEP84_11265, partial [Chloroflexi bacterium]|nr:hypothetical protein [Chloroflexota bacterium]
MTEGTIERLEALARTDPTVAPLATLQATVLRSAAAAFWVEGVPALDRSRAVGSRPLLHGATLTVDPARARSLL